MKEIFKFSISPAFDRESSHYAPKKAIDEAWKRWPESYEKGSSAAYLTAEVGSQEYDEVIAFLAKYGKSPRWGAYPWLREYGKFPIEGDRIIEKEDLENGEYFCFKYRRHGVVTQWNAAKIWNSVPILEGRLNKCPIGQVGANAVTVCTDAIKRLMEKEKFKGLTFRPVGFTAKQAPIGSYWQLWAESTFPPMLNKFIHEDGSEHPSGQECPHQEDDPFIPRLFRFSKAQVAKLAPQDVFLTKEAFGWNPPCQQHIIVSQRFRRWCDAQKFRFDWTPVALE